MLSFSLPHTSRRRRALGGGGGAGLVRRQRPTAVRRQVVPDRGNESGLAAARSRTSRARQTTATFLRALLLLLLLHAPAEVRARCGAHGERGLRASHVPDPNQSYSHWLSIQMGSSQES